MICNQAASFNRCLFKVHREMQSQLKTIRGESLMRSSIKLIKIFKQLVRNIRHLKKCLDCTYTQLFVYVIFTMYVWLRFGPTFGFPGAG